MVASMRGRTVAVTRPEAADGPLSAALAARGAHPLHRPVLDFVPIESDSLLTELATVDWLLLTSPRAVAALDDLGTFREPAPAELRVAAVGPRTAEAVRSRGWPVHVEPARAGGAELLEELRAAGVGAGSTVLFPASAQARREVPDGLTAAGATVRIRPLYAPVARGLTPAEWACSGPPRAWDALTFTSPSAVDAVVAGLPDDTLGALRTLPVGVQGPTTAAAARDAGWADIVEAHPRTFVGLAIALAIRLGPLPEDPR